MQYFFHSIYIAALLLTTGCSIKELPKHASLSDIDRFPQAIAPYVESADLNFTTNREDFLDAYYKPFSYQSVPNTLKEVLWPFHTYSAERCYGMNLQKLTDSYFYTLRKNANYDNYGTVNRYAMSVRDTNLRNFTTMEPVFYDPDKAGEGFPFDYNQNSSIHTNEPLFISHYSKDKAWVFVFTAYASGWIPYEDMLIIQTDDAKAMKEATHLYVQQDNLIIKDSEDNYVTSADIGTLFATSKEGKVIIATPKGLSKLKLDIEQLQPIRVFNQQNIREISDAILKSRYGWGGLYDERDCSSTLKDLFAPFGIYLPRNSFQQAQIGKKVQLQTLSNDEKITKIKTEARAFETLLYKRGHIVLYIGTYHDTVMVLQNMWGVKTIDQKGKEGRVVIGRAVISTLLMGSEIKNVDESNLLLNRLESMNTITLTP